MGKSSRQKRRTYQTPKRSRNGANLVWYAAAAILVIGGSLAVALSRSNSANGVGPTATDHWHVALGVNDCGTWVAQLAGRRQRRRLVGGPRTRGRHDALRGAAQPRRRAHPHGAADRAPTWATTPRSAPTSSTAAGSSTRRRSQFVNVDEKNGNKCDGKPGVLRWSVNGKEKQGNPAKYKLFNGDVIELVFTTADAKLPPKTDVPSYAEASSILGNPDVPANADDARHRRDHHHRTGRGDHHHAGGNDHGTDHDGAERVDHDAHYGGDDEHDHAMKAVVLVGGEGTRLRPLTYTTPKSLLPIANQPFLERQLAWLESHGVDEVVLSLGYLPDAFQAHFPNDRCGGVRLSYVVEGKPLGTAGGIRYAAEGGIDGRFVVCNGDILTDLDLAAMIRFHEASGAQATIALTQVEDPSAFGVVPTRADGEVVGFIEKPPRDLAPTNWINAGIYVLEPALLQRIPPRVNVSIERETFPRMVETRARCSRSPAAATGSTSARRPSTCRPTPTPRRAPRPPSGPGCRRRTGRGLAPG